MTVLAGWARTARTSIAATIETEYQREGIAIPCDKCRAPAGKRCYAPTGLPASGACEDRVKAAAARETGQ